MDLSTPQHHDLARLYAMHAWRDAENSLGGLYHSRYRGSGLDFAELRDYQPGDDLRAVHWPLSLRKGKLLSKLFCEERSTDLLLLFDATPSMRLYADKWHCALRCAALLAASALACQDAVAAMLLTADRCTNIAPATGRRQLPRILRETLGDDAPHSSTGNAASARTLGEAMEQLTARRKQRTRVAVISDLIDDSYPAPLRALSQRHDVLLCHIMSQTPRLPQKGGLMLVCDAENGQCQYAPMGNQRWRKLAAEQHAAFLSRSAAAAQSAAADYLLLPPGLDPLPALCRCFAAPTDPARRTRATQSNSQPKDAQKNPFPAESS